ncbi:MAG TPA: cation:proton antiporter [Leptolyngbya sp.]|jgi:NhaP-type Na+/H+ or K+/H+ antiporter|nr:cation:proton antiporter [Leptolyngbya sp.]
MEDSLPITVLISTTVVVGIAAQVFAKWARIPSIVFLLIFGILLGSSGMGWIDPSLLGSGLEALVSLAIALILFEGGLNLEIRELGSVSLRNLITIGVMITLLGGAIAAHVFSHFSWTTAFLYASLIVVTGPTVVTPLLKLVGVDERVATLLEGEGILIDPIGAIIAVITLSVILSSNDVPLVLSEPAIPLLVLKGLVLRLGIGVTIGVSIGAVLSLLLKRSRSLPQELKNLVVLATVWGAFSLAQVLRSESGLLVAVLIGMILRSANIPEERLIRQFNQQLGILANSVLFVLLAADLSIASVFDLGWGSVLTVLALMLIVRPINVLVSTWNRDYRWQQRVFLSWIAPRGIVAASMASLFAVSLTHEGISGGDTIKALVFLTILMTVLIQGLSASWVAGWLGLRTSQIRTVIAGDSALSQLLVEILQQKGENAVLIDLSDRTSQAKLNDIPVISNQLDLEELEAEGIAPLSTFLAMTDNPELNGMLAQRALELFCPDIVATLSQPSFNSRENPSLTTMGVQIAFAPQVLLDRWEKSLDKNELQIIEVVLQSDNFAAQQAELESAITAGEMLPLLVERSNQLKLFLVHEPWQVGDRMTLLLDQSLAAKVPALSQTNSTVLLLPSKALSEPVLQ